MLQVIQSISLGLGPWLSPAGWLALCAAAAGALSMLLYAWLAPQRRILQVKRVAAEVRRQMQRYDGDFRGAMALAGQNLLLALRQLRLTAGPALLAGLPVIAVMLLVLPALEQSVGGADASLLPQDYFPWGPAWLRSATAAFFLWAGGSACAAKYLFKIP